MKQQKDKMKDDIAHAFLSLSRAVVEKDPGTECCVKQDYLKDNSPELAGRFTDAITGLL